jgi:YspA, cpYpsA-related SLOG family
VRAGNGCGGGYFPPRAVDEMTAVDGSNARFASRSKIATTSAILRWRFGPPLSLRVLARPAHRLSDRHEGRDGRGRTGKGPPMTDHDDIELPHASSATDLVLSELQLFGYRPFDDQPDPRPLPEGKMIAGAIADIFDALVATLNDTRLEPDLDDLLWSTVNLFHRATDRINRQLDDNEQAQRKSQREQNGSEVRSVELERLTAEGITLVERRNCLELFRDQAIERFEVHTGSAWRPRSGSLVNHRTLTAALIDSRDFIAAKRRADTEVMVPPGPKIALTGGLEFNDHNLIWNRLDKVHAKHPDMVLVHGGSPKGAELIASKWATTRKVPQIAFKPDWTKHAKAAPFKRNDAMLELLPIGVMHFPGTGIQDNLADKAKRLGIPVWKFGGA